jgi:hypothetical protein
MEGSVRIANGDHVAAGYSFTFPGGHPEVHVQMANAQVSFAGNCSNGGTGTLTVPLRAGDAAGHPYDVPANSSDWFPSGDEGSPASYQGAVVANVCGGAGTLDGSRGATFSADVQADDTADAIHVRFHYRDPNAKGKGNYDCSASTYAAAVCGASWSGTASLTPDALPPATCPAGTTMGAGGTCTPVTTCPAGTTMSPGGTCTPATTCPSGTTMSPGGTCTPAITCPSGTTMNPDGTCAAATAVNSTPATGQVLPVQKTKAKKHAKKKKKAKKRKHHISRKPVIHRGFTG